MFSAAFAVLQPLIIIHTFRFSPDMPCHGIVTSSPPRFSPLASPTSMTPQEADSPSPSVAEDTGMGELDHELVEPGFEIVASDSL